MIAVSPLESISPWPLKILKDIILICYFLCNVRYSYFSRNRVISQENGAVTIFSLFYPLFITITYCVLVWTGSKAASQGIGLQVASFFQYMNTSMIKKRNWFPSLQTSKLLILINRIINSKFKCFYTIQEHVQCIVW